MDNKITPYVKVIANAVERDQDALRDFLRKHGVPGTGRMTKDELQKVLTGFLAKNRQMHDAFRAWVLKRSGKIRYKNDDGDYGPQPETNDIPFLLRAPEDSESSTVTATVQTTPVAPSGFWSGVSMNSLLDFASSNFNTYASVVKSQNEKAIVDAAVEKDRLAAQMSGAGPGTDTPTSNTPKWVWPVVGVVLAGAVGAIIFAVSKKSKATSSAS